LYVVVNAFSSSCRASRELGWATCAASHCLRVCWKRSTFPQVYPRIGQAFGACAPSLPTPASRRDGARRGRRDVRRPRQPRRRSEVAGTEAAVGPGVTDLTVGDAVVG
jgi:hypothetical protein